MIIAPSVLSADFSRLGEEIDMLQQSPAEWIHIDIMDGVFVPNISFGFPVLEAIRKRTTKYCDVHLMITQPKKWLKKFSEAGADHISIHWEQNSNPEACLIEIREYGKTSGLVINPDTAVQSIAHLLELADVLLIMSVYPGFGGQSFISSSLEKVAEARNLIQQKNLTTRIQVDGGVSTQNITDLREAGADILVAGNAVFRSPNPTETIRQMMSL